MIGEKSWAIEMNRSVLVVLAVVVLAWDTAGIWACHFDSMVIEARQDLMQG